MRAAAKRIAGRVTVAVAIATAAASLAIGFWIPAKAGVAQILLERAWQAARAGDNDARPWPWADTVPIARLAIPSLDAAWIVLSGASGRNLAFAPAHLHGSASPGQPGVAVISGHRDTHFAALRHLEPGARIEVEDAAGNAFLYAVTATRIVDSTRSRLRLDAASPFLVLTTCYPFDALRAGGPLRYVVQAALEAPIPEAPG